MNKDGKIVLIEDDQDDLDLLQNIFSDLQLPNEILTFKNGLDAYTYLAGTHEIPFIIFSDINMPVMNGFELRKKMQAFSRASLMTVPFIFITTGDPEEPLLKEFLPFTQGIYSKPENMEEYRKLIKEIIDSWKNKPDEAIID
ncbi:MAG TPA: response regulator [Ferruginibacter sp.]|nr:response regulator [Ferruginibacter sp.]